MKTSYVNLWRASKQNTRKLVFYNTFKNEFKPEGYLDQIKHISARKQFDKFRISSHQLQIETGRYRTFFFLIAFILYHYSLQDVFTQLYQKKSNGKKYYRSKLNKIIMLIVTTELTTIFS